MVQVNEETNLFTDLSDMVTEKLSDFVDKITPKKKQYAPFLQFAGAFTIPNAQTFGVMKLGGPTKGHFWYVRMVRVSGVTPSTAAPGRADLFVGPQDFQQYTTLAQCPILNWRDQMATLPLVNTYSHGAFRIAPQESLYVVLSAAGGLQQYVCSAEAFQYPDQDEDVEWVM